MNILILSPSIIFRKGLTEILLYGQPSRKVFTSDKFSSYPDIVNQSKINYCFVDFEILSTGRWIDQLTIAIEAANDVGFCLISSNNNRKIVDPAYKAGVKGLLYKEFDIDILNKALNTVLAGRIFFPCNERTSGIPPNSKNLASDITFRQKEILSLLYDGNSNKQIGRFLGISESTVKQHFSKIFKLLSVNNRVEALQKAQELKVI